MWFSFWFNYSFTFSCKFTLRSFLQLFLLFVFHKDQRINILQINGKKKNLSEFPYTKLVIFWYGGGGGDGTVEEKVAGQSTLSSELGGFLAILISFSTLPIYMT